MKARLRRTLHDLAAERSFVEVRVSDITSGAGLSRSAFYFYYEDKHDLLIESIRVVAEALFVRANVRLIEEADSRQLVHELLEANAVTWSKNADLMRMTLEASIYDKAVGSFWRGIVDDFVAAVAARVTEDQRQGRVPGELDPLACAEFLVIATEGYFYRHLSRQGGSPGDAVAVLEPIWTRVLYG